MKQLRGASSYQTTLPCERRVSTVCHGVQLDAVEGLPSQHLIFSGCTWVPLNRRAIDRGRIYRLRERVRRRFSRDARVLPQPIARRDKPVPLMQSESRAGTRDSSRDDNDDDDDRQWRWALACHVVEDNGPPGQIGPSSCPRPVALLSIELIDNTPNLPDSYSIPIGTRSKLFCSGNETRPRR